MATSVVVGGVVAVMKCRLTPARPLRRAGHRSYRIPWPGATGRRGSGHRIPPTTAMFVGGASFQKGNAASPSFCVSTYIIFTAIGTDILFGRARLSRYGIPNLPSVGVSALTASKVRDAMPYGWSSMRVAAGEEKN